MRRTLSILAAIAVVGSACAGSSTEQAGEIELPDTATSPSPEPGTVVAPTTAGDAEPVAPTAPDATPAPSPTPSPTASRTSSPTPSRTPSATPAPSPSDQSASPEPTPTPSPLDLPTGVEPARIEIPTIGVDARVVDLDLTREVAEVPEDFDTTGWYVQTRQPGEIGPAVIAGHVDSKSGPAVFFRLTELSQGDRIIVTGDDGARRTFVVDRGIAVDKYERPPEVFGFGDPEPELRLITCSGEFDPAAGHYEDNYVIFASEA